MNNPENKTEKTPYYKFLYLGFSERVPGIKEPIVASYNIKTLYCLVVAKKISGFESIPLVEVEKWNNDFYPYP